MNCLVWALLEFYIWKCRSTAITFNLLTASHHSPSLQTFASLSRILGFPPNTVKLAKDLRLYWGLWLNCVARSLSITRNTYRETRFVNGTQVKPCRSGLRTGWVTYREYRLKGTYVVLSFLLLLFCVLCGVIVKGVLKSIFSITSASGFRKKQKQSTNVALQFTWKLLYFRLLKLCRLWSIHPWGKPAN